MDEAHAVTEPPRLLDPWDRHGPIPLNGWLERHQFAPVLTAFLALLLALLLFQVLITPVVTIILLAASGVSLSTLMNDLERVLSEQARLIITANTIGQVLGIALPALMLAKWHSSRSAAFLRLRTPDLPLLGLAVFGLFALMPVVQWFGTINEWLPLPEAIRQFDRQQMDLVEKVLASDFGILFSLAMLAVTPALCEELLFRGYAQRQFERGLGVVGGILASGLLFGLYHVRLTQFLPLSLLGIYLAYLVWRTGSLWVPIVVHFANNAFAVALGAYAAEQPDFDLETLEQIEMPWYLVLIGFTLFVLTAVAIQRRARALLARTGVPVVSA